MSSFRYNNWRVDPDNRYDRGNGPVIEYKLNPEEIQQMYGHIKTNKNKKQPIKAFFDSNEVKKIREKEKQERGKKNMKITKSNVQKFAAEGKTVDEIFEMYKKEWSGKESLLKAKIALYLKENHVSNKKKKKQKIYISTSYENKDKAAKLAKIIAAMGKEIICPWWNIPYTEDEANLAAIAKNELESIEKADIIIVMLPGQYGTHVELGAALALGKKMFLFYTGKLEPVPFYRLGNIQKINSELELLSKIAENEVEHNA